MNILTAISDIDDANGGTLLIPGSHLVMSKAAREGKPVGKLPPAINLDAKAGTMVITDGRLLHGTGINHTDTPRIVPAQAACLLGFLLMAAGTGAGYLLAQGA